MGIFPMTYTWQKRALYIVYHMHYSGHGLARYCSLFCVIPLLLGSCGSNDDSLPLSSSLSSDVSSREADRLLQEAKTYEAAGDKNKAIDRYREISKKHPSTKAADTARYSEGKLLDEQGDLLKAFDAYQDLVINYPGSPHYAAAIARQRDLALAAVNGVIKNNFLGMKTEISPDRTTKMLANVRDNAPQAPSASEAQYQIGRVWQKNGNAQKALEGYLRISRDYPTSPYAPEAMFQRGQILIMKAEKGNQNRAHVNQAKDIFEDLIQRYPTHKRAKDARNSIAKLAGQDTQRSYDTAEFYRKKGNEASAIFYYKEVIRSARSGELHNMAQKRIEELSR